VPQCKFARRAIIRTANSANSHGVPAPRRHGTAAAPRRRGAALRQRFWLAGAHYFALCMHGNRGANSHGVPAPRRRGGAHRQRGAAHRHPPPTANDTDNGAAHRQRQGEFTARSWPAVAATTHVGTLPHCITWDIPGYPGLSQNTGYPGISWVISGYPDLVFIP